MKKHIDELLMIVYAIFVTVILFFLSSCSDNCECVESHMEMRLIPIDQNNLSSPINQQWISVCDKYECDTLKQTK